METFCLSYKKETNNKNSKFRRTKNYRLMVLANCLVRGNKK